jgi:hypothetical protein
MRKTIVATATLSVGAAVTAGMVVWIIRYLNPSGSPRPFSWSSWIILTIILLNLFLAVFLMFRARRLEMKLEAQFESVGHLVKMGLEDREFVRSQRIHHLESVKFEAKKEAAKVATVVATDIAASHAVSPSGDSSNKLPVIRNGGHPDG